MKRALVFIVVAGCRPPPQDRHPHEEDDPAPAADVVVAIDGDDAASGSADDPVRTIARGVALLGPGRTLLVKAGRHVLTEPIEVRVSGEPKQWVTIAGEDGAVIDARELAVGPNGGAPPYEQDQGALVLRSVAYVWIQGLTVVQSHNAAITVRDSNHVNITSNRTSHTFSSGIAVWDSQHVHVMGNDVARASDPSLAPGWFDAKTMSAPHEALTLSGVSHFEITGNTVHHGFKEGIDVKGDSKHGVVRRNDVHDMERQGIYIDAWDGTLAHVDVEKNTVHRNRSGGIVISAEGEGAVVEDVRVHENTVMENFGSGLFITRFGRDGAKRRIAIHDNQVWRNGWGPPHGDLSPLHWITGGLYVFSTNVEELAVFDNVFVDNRGFQIGVSDDFRMDGTVEAGLAAREIELARNDIAPPPAEGAAAIDTGWPRDDPDTIVPIVGAMPDLRPLRGW